MPPFAPPGTRTNFTADRSLRVVHARLDLDLDLPGKRLAGVVTLTLAARRDGLATFTLDAVEMELEGVAVDGQVAAFDYDGARLRVTCPRPIARDAEFRAEIRYRCAPRRGLYFMGPDAGHPGRALQCWTQGQDDDSRYYWPCIDHPIEKFTSEVICTAPAGACCRTAICGLARTCRRVGATRRGCAGTTCSTFRSPPTC
jgi:aminopeptidase N